VARFQIGLNSFSLVIDRIILFNKHNKTNNYFKLTIKFVNTSKMKINDVLDDLDNFDVEGGSSTAIKN
jgi:hypothetical protein